MKEYLCVCSNCGNIFIDDNPGEDSEMLEVPSGTERLKIFHTIGEGRVLACPHCCTDSYLLDIETEGQLEKFIHLRDDIEKGARTFKRHVYIVQQTFFDHENKHEISVLFCKVYETGEDALKAIIDNMANSLVGNAFLSDEDLWDEISKCKKAIVKNRTYYSDMLDYEYCVCELTEDF